MNSKNAFIEYDVDEINAAPEIFELNIISGGCHLYGYLLTPDKRIEGPYPTIIMSHGFPGYTTNNDLELALMRMGCVVIHMNHRGAWGSEGNYLFTNLKDDLIAIAKWAHNPAIADQYEIDTENIFLVGHSMGGQTVLNAAKDLPFIKGVVAMAAFDTVAPPEKMLRPLATKLAELNANVSYKSNKVILEKQYLAIYNINVAYKTPQRHIANVVWRFMIERLNYENYW